MTKQDHLDLYEELKKVLYNSVMSEQMSKAQRLFILAFEGACFDDNFLKAYAETVDADPNVGVRDLHAYCLGYGLGQSMGSQIKEESKQTH